jgi:Ion channel
VSGLVPKLIRQQDRLAILFLLYVVVANAVRLAIPDYLPSNAFTSWVASSAVTLTWVLWIALAGWVIGRIVDLYGPGDGYFARTPPWRIILDVFVSYLLAIYAFALLYFDLSVADPKGAFKPPITSLTSALYFSVVAITTTGFGDIVPESDIARWCVAGELLFGFFYTVLFFSVLATLAAVRRK